jgi:hypothetical protein
VAYEAAVFDLSRSVADGSDGRAQTLQRKQAPSLVVANLGRREFLRWGRRPAVHIEHDPKSEMCHDPNCAMRAGF